MSDWKVVAEELPEEGKLVDTITPWNGERPLRYRDGKWWLPDNSNDVLYTPTYWRAKS